MRYKLLITEKAKNDFFALQKDLQKRIADKLRFFISSKDPMQYAKKLKDSRFGTYRFRIGDYRVLFDLDNKGNIHILLILRVKHRNEVYE